MLIFSTYMTANYMIFISKHLFQFFWNITSTRLTVFALYLDQSFTIGIDLPHRGHLALSGEILFATTVQGWAWRDMEWHLLNGSPECCQTRLHRTAFSTIKKYSAQNIISAKAEKTWLILIKYYPTIYFT